MLTIKHRFKSGSHELPLFDAEAEEGKHGKLVRVDYGNCVCFYGVSLEGGTPTENEQSDMLDEVEQMFNECLHYWHTTKALDWPSETEFETNSVYCFSIS
jgi:hypothetical protein